MRRWTVRILVCVMLGVLATLGTAVTCALWSAVWPWRGTYRETRAQPGEHLALDQLGELAALIDPSQLPPEPLTEPTEASVNEEPGFGLHDSNLDIFYSREDPVRGRGFSLAARHRAGWPFAALGCTCTYRGSDRPFTPVWTPPAWLARTGYTVLTDRAGVVRRIAATRPPVPLRPIPAGFAVDSLIFAAAFLLLWLTPGTARALRHRARVRRGRCPACAYSLAGLPADAPCPECGKEAAGNAVGA